MNGQVNGDPRLHVVVLPSEEYLPPRAFGAGIFQRHQIEALDELEKFRLGVISIRLQYSLTMYARAIAHALIGRKVDNDLGQLATRALLRDGWRRLCSPRSYIEIETMRRYPVLRSTGLYLSPPSPRLDPMWWVRTGLTAFEVYSEHFGQPHLVHAHNTLNAGLLAHRIAKRTGTPYVLTEHSSYYHQGLVPVSLRGRVAAAIRNARAVFAVSDALRDSLLEWLGRNHRKGICIDVLPNVLPTEFARLDETVNRQPGRSFTFLAVGNLLPVKGQDVLLQAFARLLQWHPECQLRLIGDGPLRDDLEQLCIKLGIRDQVEFLGILESTAVRRMMLQCDALVVSSRFETFGVVVIEALSCGLPVVSTPCGGPQGLLNEQNGVLAGAVDPDSLGEAMRCMVETCQRFDSSAIQSAAHARFGRRAFAERLARLYEDVVHLP